MYLLSNSTEGATSAMAVAPSTEEEDPFPADFATEEEASVPNAMEEAWTTSPADPAGSAKEENGREEEDTEAPVAAAPVMTTTTTGDKEDMEASTIKEVGMEEEIKASSKEDSEVREFSMVDPAMEVKEDSSSLDSAEETSPEATGDVHPLYPLLYYI